MEDIYASGTGHTKTVSERLLASGAEFTQLKILYT
jgi:hypothetical protein